VGLLKAQSTLTIAVCSSVLLHAAVFLGFELAFSDKRESFPKSEPRTVTVFSINSSYDSVPSTEKKENYSLPDQNIEKISSETLKQQEKELPNLITDPTESVLNNKNTINQGDTILFSDESGDEGLSGSRKEVVLRTEPVPLEPIEPAYPFRARKKGMEGLVVLDVIVSKTGEPVSCVISDSSGYKDLDETAKKIDEIIR
jgi:outer membrane biosynthesis protein TonB